MAVGLFSAALMSYSWIKGFAAGYNEAVADVLTKSIDPDTYFTTHPRWFEGYRFP